MLNLSAGINQTGFGVFSTNVLSALHEMGNIPALFPIGGIEASPDKHQVIKDSLEKARFFDNYAPSLRISHPNDMACHVSKQLRAGYTFFELDQFTPEELHHLESLDRLFVPTKWAKSIIDRYLDIDVRVIPAGVDRSIFHDALTPRFQAEGHTVFVAIGKLEVRKGYDFLCQAFNLAFTPADKVMLRILGDNPFIGREGNEKWRSLFLRSRMGSKVFFESRVTSHSEVATVIGTSDCGIFLSRAEGWNLELLECLSVGKEAIATNYSGHTEYADRRNCRLVEVTETEPAHDGLWFHGQGNWAKLGPDQMEQTIAHMREVHSRKQNGELAGNVAGIEMAKQFSWQRTANLILEGLQ